MEINIKELTESEKEIEVTLQYDEIKKDLESEISKQTKKIQLPGFRKGKAPVALLKKIYGDALEYEASEKVASSQFWNVAKEKEINPVGTPQITDIKFNPGEKLYFKVRYEIIPDLTVKNYIDQEIEVPGFEVRDEDVEHEIEHILQANRTTQDAEIVGDDNNYIIKAEFQRVNETGEPFGGTKPEVLDVDLSNHSVQKEIVQNAKGKKPGDKFSFSFTDERTIKNKEGNEEKINETIKYNVQVKEIKKIILPELNEELIKKVTKDKLSDAAAFKEAVRKDIQNYYNQRAEEITRQKLIDSIVKNNDFVPPHSLVHNVLDDMIKNEEENSKKYGVKNFNRNEAQKSLHKAAEYQVKWYIIKNSIQRKENIAASDEDLMKMAEKDTKETGIPVEKLMNYYKSSNYGERFTDKKLFEFLKEKNLIKKTTPTETTKTESKVDDEQKI
ncbi:MAG TPA: trigger factor [Ignavibacteriaceae bacterium]|nr:trigger factor [Ignavibacteriaceae bacterium]